jgi:peptidoglycan hydrolase CwlO-like protein
LIISEARDRVSGLQNEVLVARQEIERLNSDASSTSGEPVPTADQEVTDVKRELAEARGYVTTLTRDLGYSQQEIQQVSKRAREREAALTRDLRAARRELQRANERLHVAAP